MDKLSNDVKNFAKFTIVVHLNLDSNVSEILSDINECCKNFCEEQTKYNSTAKTFTHIALHNEKKNILTYIHENPFTSNISQRRRRMYLLFAIIKKKHNCEYTIEESSLKSIKMILVDGFKENTKYLDIPKL
jgi:hypothetical protein